MVDQNPEPGWYPDGTGVERWWDGGDWTDDTHALEPVKYGRTVPEPFVVAHAEAKRNWSPGDYLTFGIIGIIVFGGSVFSEITSLEWLNVIFALCTSISVVWLVIGVVGLAIRAGRED